MIFVVKGKVIDVYKGTTSSSSSLKLTEITPPNLVKNAMDGEVPKAILKLYLLSSIQILVVLVISSNRAPKSPFRGFDRGT
jgi:hypothetical protein